MKVEWSEDAKRDLADIAEHIALDNPRAAERMDALLSKATGRLVDFPRIGREGGLSGTREIHPHRHYKIVYSIDGDTIWIEAVVHTARQWPPVAEDDA
ncbi:MAG: type II toxin-antitoxin system RelE/ParE family toxin [Mesorhizobium sp.]